MATSFQGFLINDNLIEAVNDGSILNNLGIAPIASDISLLFNNTKNTDVITVGSANISNLTVTIPNAISVFSNRTPISVGGNQYYVTNSNSINQFQLSSNPALTGALATPIAGNYIRSNTVTRNNINNFFVTAKRKENNSGASATGSTAGASASSNIDDPASLSVGAVAVLKAGETNLDYFKFKASNSLVKTASFLGKKKLQSEGFVNIQDPDNVNITGLTASTPGMFIYSVAARTGVRAFSNSTNVWSIPVSDNTVISTSAEEITVGSLVIEANAINLNVKSGATIVTSLPSGSPITDFTHTLPFIINGDTYYLCLVQNN